MKQLERIALEVLTEGGYAIAQALEITSQPTCGTPARTANHGRDDDGGQNRQHRQHHKKLGESEPPTGGLP
jgi:hypothetical protein